MIKTKEYNQVNAKTLIPTKDQLRPGKTATFRLTGLRPDPDNPGNWIIPELVSVPTTDRIYDYDQGESVQIAAVKSIDATGKPDFHTLEFRKQNAGMIILSGDSASDLDKFEYLYLSNYNASNEKRDKSKMPFFEYVDPEKDAKAKLDNMKHLVHAIDILGKMTIDEIRDFASSLNWHDEEELVIRARVTEFAKDNPEHFLKLVNMNTRETRALVNRAMRLGKIKYIASGRKFVYGGSEEPILIVPNGSPDERIDFFVNWLITNEAGRPVADHIKDLVAEGKK